MANRIYWPLGLATLFAIALATAWWARSSASATALTSMAPVRRAPETVLAPNAAATKSAGAAPSPPALKLLGTVVAAKGAESFALMRRTSDSELLRLHMGDRVEDLTVSVIQSDHVVLASAGQAFVIKADQLVGVTQTVVVTPRVVPFRARTAPPEPEPAWAGDPAAFGH